MESGRYVQTFDASSILAQAAGFVSCAAAAAQAWDAIVSLGDEVEFLWRGKFRLVKALYFASRHGLLAAQVLNQLLNFQSAARPSDDRLCAGILVFKSVTAQSALTLVEMILLIRVYALYNQSFKARSLLASVFVVSTVLETSGMGMIVRSLAKATGCTTPRVDKQAVMLSGIGAGLCQFVVFVTTIVNLLPGGRRRTPLTSLMLKEGVVSFVLLGVLLAIMITCEIVRNYYLKKDGGAKNIKQVGNAAFSWYLAFLSIVGSRLILNMRKVAAKHLSMFRNPEHRNRQARGRGGGGGREGEGEGEEREGEGEQETGSSDSSIYLTSLVD